LGKLSTEGASTWTGLGKDFELRWQAKAQLWFEKGGAGIVLNETEIQEASG